MALCYDLKVNLGFRNFDKVSFHSSIKKSFVSDVCKYNRYKIAKYFADPYGAYQQKVEDGFIVHLSRRKMHKLDAEFLEKLKEYVYSVKLAMEFDYKIYLNNYVIIALNKQKEIIGVLEYVDVGYGDISVLPIVELTFAAKLFEGQ